ncbi:stearoyl-CoA desaturase (Delta-9 desaturase) [Phycisphaerales bacterium]|nr:stearoyl-CoA desaturase (Delta-9 desaturase) [Phycisphaerales bacterium]
MILQTDSVGEQTAHSQPASCIEGTHPGGEPMERPSLLARTASLVVVVVPLIGLVTAVALLWGTGFSWVHLGLLVGGYVLTALGITVGYHRFFTHKSFETNAVVKAVLGVLGSMAVEGSIMHWVATHRRHHQHSDRDSDPHSPNTHGGGLWEMIKGVYHAHIGWFFTPAPVNMERYVPDLAADGVTRWVSRLFPLWVALGLLIPGGIALAITGSWIGAGLGVLWGGVVRVFLVHHVTWSINSVCHLWGTRPFDSRDHSRNNVIFGILGLGEGWHNNHHAFPTSARHGLSWWQIDIGYMVIRTLEFFGLARAIRVPAPDRIAGRRAGR